MKDQQTPQTATPTTSPSTATKPDTGQQDFGSNSALSASVGSEEQGSGSATETPPTLTHEQKVQAIVDKMGTNIGTNPLRQEYMEAVRGLTVKKDEMKGQGATDETIGRTLHQMRIDIGKQYKALTPGPLREYILEVNMGRYGNEYGPSVEFLLDKYKGDWAKIIDGACSPNENVDRLLAGFKTWLLGKPGGYVDAAHAEWCK
jgi:hypothetical protein